MSVKRRKLSTVNAQNDEQRKKEREAGRHAEEDRTSCIVTRGEVTVEDTDVRDLCRRGGVDKELVRGSGGDYGGAFCPPARMMMMVAAIAYGREGGEGGRRAVAPLQIWAVRRPISAPPVQSVGRPDANARPGSADGRRRFGRYSSRQSPVPLFEAPTMRCATTAVS